MYLSSICVIVCCCIVDSLLVRGVMRLSDHDIAAVFTASQPLLHWAYTHEPLRSKSSQQLGMMNLLQ